MAKEKKFPPISEIGEMYNEQSFFKKQIGFKKQISNQQRTNLLTRLKKYNKFYCTSFFIKFEQVGEADLFTAKEIQGGITPQEAKKIKSVFKKTGDIIDTTGQYKLDL